MRLSGPYLLARIYCFKTFVISECYRVQSRGEVFNFMDHANFGIPATTMNAATRGTIATAADGRVIQLGLKIYF